MGKIKKLKEKHSMADYTRNKIIPSPEKISKIDHKEGIKLPEYFFGKALFILIIAMVAFVYIMLIFNRISAKIGYLKHFILYIILGVLVFSLIIFLHPSIGGITKAINEKIKTKREERIKRALEKKVIKEKKRRLKEEKRKKKEEERIKNALGKESKKTENLRLKEEKGGKKRESKVPLIRELSKNLKIDIGKYETDIDALYKIIEKTGRIKLSAISDYFGIDKKKAEEWATILNEHGLAEIHYPAIGEPELRRKITEGTQNAGNR